MKKRKIIWQIYPTYLIILFMSLIAVSWVGFSSFKNFYLIQATDNLEARALIFQHQLTGELLRSDPAKVDAFCKEIGKASGTRITVILPSGWVVGDSDEDPERMEIHSTREEILAAKDQGVGRAIRYSSTLEQNMMYVAIPVKEKGELVCFIRTSIPIEAIDSEIRSVWFKLAFGGFLIAIVLGALSLLVARRLSRPIREMKDAAGRFAQGDLTRKAEVYETEELAGLSEAMNQMAKELDDRINTISSQRNELETVLSSMMEGVIAVDNSENIIKINASAAAMFHIDPETCEGRSIQELIRNISFQKFVAKALSENRVVESDISIYNDEERILQVQSSPINDAAGEKIGTLIVMEDVSRLRRLENVRRDFVANVSHEIKTPLTAIKGFVETLYHDMGTEKAESKRFLSIILKHVDRLNAIVDDLLSLSNIEKEKDGMEIQLLPTDLKEVIETAIQVCHPKAEEKNIAISMQMEDPVMGDLDTTLLEQAIVNLIDNAVKYSDTGSSVDIEAKETDTEIVIGISDHGIGISKEHLPRLFERFYRVDKARSRKMGGTGLGLSIVKHIVQAHGGTIEANSTLGKGSTFTIHLPKSKSLEV